MLSAVEARQLDRLALGASPAAVAASASGVRRTARTRGSGIEFQDYRHYQPGDDPRSIDWTVEARLNQLVVRVCRADGHIRLHLLVDASASMAVGVPDKFHSAAKLAAALTYIAVERRDEVGVATFGDTVRTHVAPAAGRPQMFRVLDTLAAARAEGVSRIGGALVDYGTAARRGGLVVVISDFFEPGGALDGLRFLLYRGYAVGVVQVLAPEETRPAIEGELELVDIEHPDAPPLVVDSAALRAYHEGLSRQRGEIQGFCAAHRLPLVQVTSSDSFDALVRACVGSGLLAAYG